MKLNFQFNYIFYRRTDEDFLPKIFISIILMLANLDWSSKQSFAD